MHGRPENSEQTRYMACKQVEKNGITPIEFQQMPELADECRDLWLLFNKLSPISYSEIQAYTNLTGDDLSRWEIEALMQLDAIRMNPPKEYKWQI